VAFNLKNEPPRLPAPKQGKVKNSAFRQNYKRENPNCEICRFNGDNIPASELHHIEPKGRGGPDLLWNSIHLCNGCHRECTEHLKGTQAIANNMMCFSLKLLKKEISKKTLTGLNIYDIVYQLKCSMELRWNQLQKGLF